MLIDLLNSEVTQTKCLPILFFGRQPVLTLAAIKLPPAGLLLEVGEVIHVTGTLMQLFHYTNNGRLVLLSLKCNSAIPVIFLLDQQLLPPPEKKERGTDLIFPSAKKRY